MPHAFITGASSGIGKEFAVQLAERGFDLVLVARDEDRLNAVGKKISQKYGVDYEVIKSDLSKVSEVNELADKLKTDRFSVEFLVNNAGFGLNKAFHKSSPEEEKALLEVLVTAPLVLTQAALTRMLENQKGYVVNVGSVAAWITSGTYSAAKSWLHSFTESMHAQYSKQGIIVSAVAPGFTKTEFHQRANINMSGVPSWLWLEDKKVVKAAIEGALAAKSLIVPGVQYKALKLMADFMPRSTIRSFSNFYQTKRRGN
jgi:short-subunit dehydrogenase